MVQTMPFARPRLDDVLAAVDTVTRTGAPPRGDGTGPRVRAEEVDCDCGMITTPDALAAE
jgi:hypothetical protein